MALVFPLAHADFQDTINVASAPFRLQRFEELSGLGSGQFLTGELAPPLWSASVRLHTAFHDDGLDIQSRIDSLDGSLHSFLFYDPRTAFPRLDPEGALLAGAAPVVLSIEADNKSLRLGGLPAGYQLSSGDMLSFEYGVGPVRRTLHRLLQPALADALGETAPFEVRPHFGPGVATGGPVELIKPSAFMRIVPNTLNVSEADDLGTVAIAFSALQRLHP
ncbi:hypothetical protein [Nitratireductor pacificus]|uniref:Uncharacterized protein n=1 Tax=Nitratireductor pacificus pht-3B TaxID=391937 RepID=K2MIS7_9HYPH|nr:hypothetical protein [Nitratireductor pacificus]EKF17062.1 hypothetical protein NA2_19868 [Nitratireductor pacificus pht-3B]